MTTREATAALALSDDNIDKSWQDRLTVIAFGAIQWPWLLRSLHGGRRADKFALLDALGLPHDALPNLGSWKADTHFLAHIVRAVMQLEPEHVVELGCGASSLVLAQAMARHGGGQLSSFDQHADFCRATGAWLAQHGHDADIAHAPLGPPPAGWPGSWYQLTGLPPSIDLLVIDGPPWAIHPLVRGAAETLFARVRPGGIILLDDAARPGERIVAGRWRMLHPDIDFIYDGAGAKGTLIGVKRA